MKKFKKLIPALCMLLVSAVMLGSTTFAWFSMNRTVTATGMQIKAEVPTQLLISLDNSEWKSSVEFGGSTADVVAPVTAVGLAQNANLVPDFYKLTDAGMQKVKEDGTLDGVEVTAPATDTTNFEKSTNDVYTDKFYLQLAGKKPEGTAAALNAKVTISSQSATAASLDIITKALHIVIVDKDKKVLVNQDLGTLLTGDDALKITPGEGKELSIGKIFDFTADNETKELDIYVFYDGTDSDCMNANAISVNGLKLSFAFTLGA